MSPSHVPAVDTTKIPRVLHVLEATLGGTLHYLNDVLNVLSPDSFELGFAYSLRRAEAGFEDFLQRARAKGWQTFHLDMERQVSLSDDMRSGYQLRKLIRDFKPDIIHGHSSKAGAISRIFSMGIAPNPMVVYSPHAIATHLGKPYFLAERLLSLRTDRFIAVSDSEAKGLVDQGLANHENVDVVYPMIDMSYYHPQDRASAREEVGFPADGKVVIGIGRLTEQKDPLAFLDVVEKVIRTNPGVTAIWLGEGHLREAFLEKVRALGLEDSISLPGWKADVRPYLAASDVLLSTSLYESFGYMVAEAMAMERAVVATSIAGTMDVFGHENPGSLYSSGDSDQAAKLVCALLNEPVRSQEQERYGRRLIGSRFSASVMSQSLQDCYRSVLQSRS